MPGSVAAWVSFTAGLSMILDVGVAAAGAVVHVTVLAWLSLLAVAPLLALLVLETA